MKTINQKYERRYNAWKKMSFYMNDMFGFFSKGHLESMFQTQFIAELEQAHKEHFPRRKKINLQNLPEEVVSPIRTKWQDRTLRAWEQEKVYFQALVNWLNENAKLVNLENKWQIVYKQEKYTYNSQPNNMGYAYGDVKRKTDKLDKLAIPYEIHVFGYDENYKIIFGDLKAYHSDAVGYCLYAPIAPYQLDAIGRNNPETLLEWAISCWRNGQNPKVLSPFLPDEIFDKSMRAVFHGE